ncbi:hypothetical protein [Streptomyces sp. NPDC056987]|uniref:hypothetical protein n=1 Tax=Streptomyces sp. NPDC056987 TaxID=3345988 RepID=UPI003626AFC9
MASPTFPEDLLQAQREWNRTYEALAASCPGTTVLRRRLLRLSDVIAHHPFLAGGPGRSSALRCELRRAARETAATDASVGRGGRAS